jgi:hypothetical protein
MADVGAPAGTAQPDAHRSPWRRLRHEGGKDGSPSLTHRIDRPRRCPADAGRGAGVVLFVAPPTGAFILAIYAARAGHRSGRIAAMVSGVLRLATIVCMLLYGGWIGVAVTAVVAVLVFAWVRSRSKPPPPGPDDAQREGGIACGFCAVRHIWTDLVGYHRDLDAVLADWRPCLWIHDDVICGEESSAPLAGGGNSVELSRTGRGVTILADGEPCGRNGAAATPCRWPTHPRSVSGRAGRRVAAVPSVSGRESLFGTKGQAPADLRPCIRQRGTREHAGQLAHQPITGPQDPEDIDELRCRRHRCR